MFLQIGREIMIYIKKMAVHTWITPVYYPRRLSIVFIACRKTFSVYDYVRAPYI
jgi:hypothetical protein